MLRPETLEKILSRTNTGGIKCTLLLNKDGTLVSASGSWGQEDYQVIASLASGLWSTYEKARKLPQAPNRQPKLNCLVLEYENGLVGMTVLEGSSMLVCCLAENVEEMGLVRRKVITIAECINESMQ